MSIPPSVAGLLEQLAKHLRSSVLDKSTATQLAKALPQLIRVPAHPEYHNLLKLAPTIAERELPLGLNISLPDFSSTLANVTQQARIRWASRTGVLGSMPWDSFSRWVETPELARLGATLVYLSPSAREAFSEWIGQQKNLPARAIGPCFALMDCQAAFGRAAIGQVALTETTIEAIVGCATRIMFKQGERVEYQRWATQTLVNTIHALPDELNRIIRIVSKRMPSNPRDVVHQHVFSFLGWASSRSTLWEEVVDSVVDSALLWFVRRFAEDETDSLELLETLPNFGT